MFGVLAAELLLVTRSSGVKLGGSLTAMRGMTTEGVFAMLDALYGDNSIRLFSPVFVSFGISTTISTSSSALTSVFAASSL